MNVSAIQRPVLLLEVSTPQGAKAYLDVSALQRNVLLLKVSTYTTGTCAASERICTTESCAAPGGV
jgi:hypothetical protein